MLGTGISRRLREPLGIGTGRRACGPLGIGTGRPACGPLGIGTGRRACGPLAAGLAAAVALASCTTAVGTSPARLVRAVLDDPDHVAARVAARISSSPRSRRPRWTAGYAAGSPLTVSSTRSG
jgi:hypothetical protein